MLELRVQSGRTTIIRPDRGYDVPARASSTLRVERPRGTELRGNARSGARRTAGRKPDCVSRVGRVLSGENVSRGVLDLFIEGRSP
jgi:hypothetical protein